MPYRVTAIKQRSGTTDLSQMLIEMPPPANDALNTFEASAIIKPEKGDNFSCDYPSRFLLAWSSNSLEHNVV